MSSCGNRETDACRTSYTPTAPLRGTFEIASIHIIAPLATWSVQQWIFCHVRVGTHRWSLDPRYTGQYGLTHLGLHLHRVPESKCIHTFPDRPNVDSRAQSPPSPTIVSTGATPFDTIFHALRLIAPRLDRSQFDGKASLEYGLMSVQGGVRILEPVLYFSCLHSVIRC